MNGAAPGPHLARPTVQAISPPLPVPTALSSCRPGRTPTPKDLSPASTDGKTLGAMPRTETVVPIEDLRRPRDTFSRPLRDLRISVMDRCNFRCPYCMPKEQFHEHYRFLKYQERLSFEEIVRLARLFAELGVRKLRLTGGEPLLRSNLADLIGDLTDRKSVV